MAGGDPDDRRVQRELTREESLARLGSVPLGRVVFTDQALPAVRPAHHLLDGGQVVISSYAGAAIATAAERGVVVAYQADAIDPEQRVGWSVVVTGVAWLVKDLQAEARYQRLLRPGRHEQVDRVIAIRPDLVAGFALTRCPAG